MPRVEVVSALVGIVFGLYPAHKASLETQFKAQEKDKQTQFTIKVGGAVTPKP